VAGRFAPGHVRAFMLKLARMESLRDALTDMKGTLLLVGSTLLGAVAVVCVLLAVRSTGPAGDVVAKTTNFRVAMPKTLRAGHHTFAYTNEGSVPHELLLFRTDLAGNSLPMTSDGNVNEQSALLHSVADSGNATSPGGSEAVPTKEALAPGHYVAVCNLPGHYRLGMWLNVAVVP
jgi:uncharacterized cupredoxin-like copper-binding protein